MLGQTSRVCSARQNKENFHIHTCPQTLSFRGRATIAELEPFRFLSVGDTSPTQFECLSNHSQPPQDLWKSATIHDQTWQYVLVEDILSICCEF